MSESILKALMQLFAIVAHVNKDGVSDKSRKIVENYLKQLLNQELVNEYLALFEHYIDKHHQNITKKDGRTVHKRTSSNSVKVLVICQQINEELQRDQKYLVVFQLLEFIRFGEEITHKELDFIETVAEIFKIERSEYQNIKTFILDPIEAVPQKERVLLINDKESAPHPAFKHIKVDNLNGQIFVLHIPMQNIFAFAYMGNDTLFMNGHAIIPNRIYVLVNGSTIRSSKINPIYYSDVTGKFLQDSVSEKVVFTAKNIEFRFKNSVNGIQEFTFSEESGHLVGIMGGSGVGKSTLLNVLNGNLKPRKGSIIINGFDLHNDKDKLEGVIGFVPQDDLLIEELTVYQNLYYNAKLCFDAMSEEDIQKAVDKVLYDLDLFEIRNLKVGNALNKYISGGQRKRLNIALELIREPSVLFVDEPTSGLSSMDSDMVMDLLKELSLKGKLIIVNIHQPSSDIYKLFDKLLIMDKGGHPIYQGNPVDAVIYFKKLSNYVNPNESECTCCGNVNPEQVLQLVEAKVVDEYGKLTRERKTSSKEWYKEYKERIEQNLPEKKSINELPKNDFKIPNKLRQLKIFVIRDVLSKLTNTQYLLITFLEAPLLAFILGFFSKYISGKEGDLNAYVFSHNENIPAFMFMCVVVSLFLGMTVSAEEIIKDARILKREQFLNLSRFSYLNSKVIILFVISAIQSFTFVIIGNSILGIKDMFFPYWLMLFTTSCFANLLGLNISSGLNSIVTIYILIPFLLVPQLLLSGIMVKFDKLHKSLSSAMYVPLVGDMMASRWAYEGLAVYQFKNNAYQKQFFEIESVMSQAGYQYSYLIPKLIAKTEIIEKNCRLGLEPENTEKAIRLLSNELVLMNEKTTQMKLIRFADFDKLNKEHFDENLVKKIKKYLDVVRVHYVKMYNEAMAKKDQKYESLIEQLGSNEAVTELKEKNYNENLADFVLNKTDINKITEASIGRFVQKVDPIYQIPESNFGRAHFYAPVKIIFGKKVETYWFNISVLWAMTLLMYIALYYNWLRKIVGIGERSKFFKIFKKK